MTWQRPAPVQLLDQGGGKVPRIMQAAGQHPPENPLGSGSGDDRAGSGPQHRREQHVSQRGAAPDTASAAVIVGVERHHPGDAWIVAGGERQRDGPADRLAGQDRLADPGRIEEGLDGVGEVGGGVVGVRRAGLPVSGQVNGKHFGLSAVQVGQQRDEVLQLCPQGMQQDDRRTGPGAVVAQLAAADTDAAKALLDEDWVGQRRCWHHSPFPRRRPARRSSAGRLTAWRAAGLRPQLVYFLE